MRSQGIPFALFATLLFTQGCPGEGVVGDDDDDLTGDDDTTGDDDSDCVHPDDELLTRLYEDVQTYLTCEDPGEDPPLLAELDGDYAGICFEHFADAIRHWPSSAPGIDVGVSMTGYWVDVEEMGANLHVYVPEGLDLTGSQRLPLALWLHGAGGAGGGIVASAMYQQMADDNGMVLAAPHCLGHCDWSASEGCAMQALSALRHLKRQLPLDHDRIYLTGHSMGGRGSFTVGLTYPQEFAGLAPAAGSIGAIAATTDVQYHHDYCYPHAENGLHQRIHLQVGQDDLNYLVAQNEGAAAAFDELEVDFRFMALEGVGHAMDMETWYEGMAWLAEVSRDPHPEQVVFNVAEHLSSYYDDLYFHDQVPLSQYWIGVDERTDSGAPARIEAEINGDTLEISTENVAQLSVLLADELVDLDGPITIRVDGEIWFQGAVARDPRLALEYARRRQERSMVVAGRVEGLVPGQGTVEEVAIR